MNTDLLNRILTLPSQFPGMDRLYRETVYLLGSRSFDQFCCMVRSLIVPKKFCPFCENELHRRGRKPFAKVGNWLILKNEFPHKSTAQMWLIVPKRHLAHMSDLGGQDWQEIGAAFELCRTRLGIIAGGVMFRFGDPRLNMGTVEHLHINVIEPICGKEYRPPFAKNGTEHIDDYFRMLGFRDELIERGGETWLFSQAGIEQTQPTK